MCELLAMSANTPTDLCFSFTGLTRRGGQTGPHKDGWGVAFYEGKGVRAFHDADASGRAPNSCQLTTPCWFSIRPSGSVCTNDQT